MSLFTNLTGDKKRDKELLADIKATLGDTVYSEQELEALDLGRVMYSVLKINGKIRAAKPWEKLKIEEQLRWGGIAVDVMDAIDEQLERLEDQEDEEAEVEVGKEFPFLAALRAAAAGKPFQPPEQTEQTEQTGQAEQV